MNGETVIVDGMEYRVFWQDLVSHMRMTVFCGSNRIGHRDLEIRVDKGPNVMQYVIRKLARDYGSRKDENESHT